MAEFRFFSINIWIDNCVQVMNGAVLQQVFVVEFTVNNNMCDDCHRVEAKDFWRAVVQIRQKVSMIKSTSNQWKSQDFCIILYNYYNNYTPKKCARTMPHSMWNYSAATSAKTKNRYMYKYLMNQNLFFHFRLITRRPFSSWNSWSWSTKLTPTQLISKLSTVGILC